MSMMLNILTKSKIKVPLNHNHVCICNSHSDNTPPHCRHNSISDRSCNEHIYYILVSHVKNGHEWSGHTFLCDHRIQRIN